VVSIHVHSRYESHEFESVNCPQPVFVLVPVPLVPVPEVLGAAVPEFPVLGAEVAVLVFVGEEVPVLVAVPVFGADVPAVVATVSVFVGADVPVEVAVPPVFVGADVPEVVPVFVFPPVEVDPPVEVPVLVPVLVPVVPPVFVGMKTFSISLMSWHLLSSHPQRESA